MNKVKIDDMSYEGKIRYLTYMNFINTYRIVDVFRKHFGKDNVDSTVFYENNRAQIVRILNKPASSFISNIQSDVGNSMLIAVRIYNIWEKAGYDIRTLIDGYGDIPLYEFLIRQRSKLGVEVLMMYFKYFPRFALVQRERFHPEIEKTLYYRPSDCVNEVNQMVYVHFDEITITQNEDEKIKHKVNDYFVALNTSAGLISSLLHAIRYNQIGLLGTKMTYAKDEFMSCYVHSHRPRLEHDSYNELQFVSHCVGSRTPIRDIVSKIENIMTQKENYIISKILITQYASILKTYLEVESTSGGPYMRIQSIGNNNNSREVVPDTEYACGSALLNCAVRKHESVTAKIIDEMFDLNLTLHLVTFRMTSSTIEYAQCKHDVLFALYDLFMIVYKKIKYELNLDGINCIPCFVKNDKIFYRGDGGSNPRIENVQDKYIRMCNKEYNFKLTDEQNETTFELLPSADMNILYCRFYSKAKEFITAE